MSSIEPNDGSSEIDSTEKVPCPLVVARCNGSILLEFGKEILDPVAGFVQLLIILTQVLTVASRRNHYCLALSLKSLNDSRIGIVALISETVSATIAGSSLFAPSRSLVCPAARGNSKDCPMHPLLHESWCLVRLCCDPLLLILAPPPLPLHCAGKHAQWWKSIIAYSLSASSAKC